ncbi:MAG TPA: hypothetical protein VE860_20305 [Chthoniobacterales bacterium]|jgi:hypothetical protein|nr:hypothetical protein [Chthoniobacterales bacterium]
MKRRIICLVDGDEKAQELTQKLSKRGVPESEIFVLSCQPDQSEPVDRQNQQEHAETQVSAGQRIGLFAGIGPALVGAAGPFLTADITSGVGAGETDASKGEAFRLLDRFELSNEVAQKYKDALAAGGILIAIQLHPESGDTIRRILEEERCQDIIEA